MANIFTDYLMYKLAGRGVYHYKVQPCSYERTNEVTGYTLWNGSNINISVTGLQPGDFNWLPLTLTEYTTRLEIVGLSLPIFEQWLTAKNMTITTMRQLDDALLECEKYFVANEENIRHHLPREKYGAFIDEVKRLDLFNFVDWEGIHKKEKINLYDSYLVIHHERHSYYFEK